MNSCCSFPKIFPAPRISKSRMAILKPLPSSLNSLMASKLMLDAYISEDYVSSQSERIIFYNKISRISTLDDYKQVISQFEESCGAVPVEVENLCKIAFLKNLATNCPELSFVTSSKSFTYMS